MSKTTTTTKPAPLTSVDLIAAVRTFGVREKTYKKSKTEANRAVTNHHGLMLAGASDSLVKSAEVLANTLATYAAADFLDLLASADVLESMHGVVLSSADSEGAGFSKDANGPKIRAVLTAPGNAQIGKTARKYLIG